MLCIRTGYGMQITTGFFYFYIQNHSTRLLKLWNNISLKVSAFWIHTSAPVLSDNDKFLKGGTKTVVRIYVPLSKIISKHYCKNCYLRNRNQNYNNAVWMFFFLLVFMHISGNVSHSLHLVTWCNARKRATYLGEI